MIFFPAGELEAPLPKVSRNPLGHWDHSNVASRSQSSANRCRNSDPAASYTVRGFSGYRLQIQKSRLVSLILLKNSMNCANNILYERF
jgi:hypothetical protein